LDAAEYPKTVLTESELVEAEGELQALQRHALAMVDPEIGWARN
jgi:hypothetical protein